MKSINLNIEIIDTVLTDFYKNRISKTKIGKTRKLSMGTVKKIISSYGETFLKANPQLNTSNISVDQYEIYLKSKNAKKDNVKIEVSSMLDY